LEDLITADTGFAEVARAVFGQLPPDPRGNRADAMQAAKARFDTNGFSAAALTVLSLGTMCKPPAPHRAIERTVEVRFNRPFAVVAAISRGTGVAFEGLPAFGAWVTEPAEPSEPNETEGEW
jgi:hypothetical protein